MMCKLFAATFLLFGVAATGAEATCPSGNFHVCSISAGPNTTANLYYATYAWTATAAVKSETLGDACPGTSNDGETIIVKDESGTAASYPITVTPQTGNTIDGAATFVLGLLRLSAES
jgi:hypothetical protein